jgi:molybdate transport system substrate-binding protein
MFSALLQKLGIADEVNKKAVLGKGGHDVAVLIAEGRAELGTTFISEVLPVRGAKVVGPLPGHLHTANTYTAAIHKSAGSRAGAEALLRKLTDPATRGRYTAAGLEPAF